MEGKEQREGKGADALQKPKVELSGSQSFGHFFHFSPSSSSFIPISPLLSSNNCDDGSRNKSNHSLFSPPSATTPPSSLFSPILKNSPSTLHLRRPQPRYPDDLYSTPASIASASTVASVSPLRLSTASVFSPETDREEDGRTSRRSIPSFFIPPFSPPKLEEPFYPYKDASQNSRLRKDTHFPGGETKKKKKKKKQKKI